MKFVQIFGGEMVAPDCHFHGSTNLDVFFGINGDSSLNLLIFECTHYSLGLLAGDPNAGLRTRLSRSDNSLRPAELNSS